MKIQKIKLDVANRMARIGLGKHEGNWFFRVDLWFSGFRFKGKEIPKSNPIPNREIHYIQSKEHKWRIWVTKKLNQTDQERFRDKENNYPIIVPPTSGDRIDILSKESVIKDYHYDFKGLVVVIKQGKIESLIY